MAVAACSSFNDDSDPYHVSEATKDLSGTWKISTATRNGTDITAVVDFSQFALHLNTDGTYTLENYLPFVARHDGTWSIDDPKYPFKLFFTEAGSQDTTHVEMNYPIQNGARELLIKLSPGCGSNTYTYTMVRTSN